MENNELLLAIKALLDENSLSLRGEMNSLRNDMQLMREELTGKIDGVKEELTGRIDSTNAKIDGIKEDLTAQIDSTKDEIISYIKQNNIAIAEIVTESAEQTEGRLSKKIDELANVTAKNCYDITELRARAK